MNRRSSGWAVLGGVAGAAIGFAIGWALAGDDVRHVGDWRAGGLRFIGVLGALGAAGGYLATRRLTRGPRLTRSGFTLSYAAIVPKTDGYRDLTTLTVADVVSALRAAGYQPAIEACDDAGERRGAIDADRTPLAGAHVALRDPGVRGWVRVQLAPPREGQPRGLGLLEVWSEPGPSAEELGLFVLRALDGLIGGLAAGRDTSRLGKDPASLLTSALGDRPVYRRG